MSGGVGRCGSGNAFSLLEILTVIVIAVIMLTMLAPGFHSLRAKAERQNCVGNLKSLYAAASAYVQDQGEWPQVDVRGLQRPAYALQWIDAFKPYGIAPESWICPTVQRQLRNPDYRKPENARVDYLATPFDDGPRTPYKWPTHPWFVERGDVHGDGQLVIFTNTEVKSLKEIFTNPAR